MECELCGSEGKLKKAKIEGKTLSVCPKCAQLGKEISKGEKITKTKKTLDEPQITPDFNNIIKQAREKQKLSRKELAEKINVKESIITHLENKKMYPQIKIAKKLERALKINLTDYKEQEEDVKEADNKPLTLGDVATIKKK